MESNFLRKNPFSGELPKFTPSFAPDSPETRAVQKRREITLNEGYLDLPLEQAVDLRKVFSIAREDRGLPPEFSAFVFEFRGILKPGIDLPRLLRVDNKAREAAQQSDGFLFYHAYEGLSFCGWENREDASAAIMHPDHLEAVKLFGEMYESAAFNRHDATRRADGSVELKPVET